MLPNQTLLLNSEQPAGQSYSLLYYIKIDMNTKLYSYNMEPSSGDEPI